MVADVGMSPHDMMSMSDDKVDDAGGGDSLGMSGGH